MDANLLARIQFAITVGFHFLFPPLSIGLAWLLVILEWRGWRKSDVDYVRAGKFFAKIFALTFGVGVATGIVMEFQFGTNWAPYSKMVGDIFGAPLAAEGLFAFFLESVFLGVYLFGRNKLSKGWHWFSILMVALGATLSAFWIIVANSWMQTPAGFVFNTVTQRAELTNFWQAVFNPSTGIRYFHTVMSCLVAGAFMMTGISAALLLKDSANRVARKSLGVGIIFGLISSILVAFPSGHEHAKQVAHTQPAKFAAIEGLYTSQSGAPLVMFAVPFTAPPELKAKVELPGLLSWMAFGDVNAHIPGIDQFKKEDLPPLWMTFVSFHNMVILGMFFITAMMYGTWLLYRGKLWTSRKFLRVLFWSIPLPLAATQFGWVTAEVGRQPWIVYPVKGVFEGMRTSAAASVNVSAGQILFSIILFGIIYLFLLSLYLYVLWKKISEGPETDGSVPTNPKSKGPLSEAKVMA